MSDPGWVKFSTSGGMAIWSCGGAWTIDHATCLAQDLAVPAEAQGKAALIDLAAIDQLDTSGAWLLRRHGNALVEAGFKVETKEGDPDLAVLLKRVVDTQDVLPAEAPRRNLGDKVAEIGASVETILAESRDLLAFFGALVTALVRLAMTPWKLR
jgi:phospholipid/cholesterol/gamma-HCH transport system permease protein